MVLTCDTPLCVSQNIAKNGEPTRLFFGAGYSSPYLNAFEHLQFFCLKGSLCVCAKSGLCKLQCFGECTLNQNPFIINLVLRLDANRSLNFFFTSLIYVLFFYSFWSFQTDELLVHQETCEMCHFPKFYSNISFFLQVH